MRYSLRTWSTVCFQNENKWKTIGPWGNRAGNVVDICTKVYNNDDGLPNERLDL